MAQTGLLAGNQLVGGDELAQPEASQLVEVSGLEPPTSSLRTKRSSHLSYTPAVFKASRNWERWEGAGAEQASRNWKRPEQNQASRNWKRPEAEQASRNWKRPEQEPSQLDAAAPTPTADTAPTCRRSSPAGRYRR